MSHHLAGLMVLTRFYHVLNSSIILLKVVPYLFFLTH